MREIKFEYVCKHTYAGDERILKHVLDLHSIEDIDDIVEFICSEIDPCTCSFNESQNYCDCDSILDHGEFEIVARRQYTGLKDRNGAEIYEGDIVNHWKQGNRVVVYPMSETYAGFGVVSVDGMKNVLNDATNLYEVIGNIHQNPELLESNND